MRRPDYFCSLLLIAAVFIVPRVSAGGARGIQQRLSTIPGSNPHSYSLTEIGNQCIAFSEVSRSDFLDCRVSQSGRFGAAQGLTYYYALYCIIPKNAAEPAKCGDDSFTARYHSQRGMAIFTQEGSNTDARLLLERASSEIGILTYGKPEIVQTAAGTILHVSIAFDGTGHFNGSEYYVLGDGWELLEADSWVAELQKRVPAGLAIWKGVWPDLHTMQAVAGLYRSGDGNCCPTGGMVRVKLSIRSKQFLIDSLVVDAPAETR